MGGVPQPAEQCWKLSSCDPENFWQYPASYKTHWTWTVVFTKDRTCYRYNLAHGSDSTHRYAIKWTQGGDNPCGENCDCGKVCSKQAECKGTGNYCDSDHRASDGECWCRVFTQSNWEGVSKTKVYCEDQMTIDAIRAEAMMINHVGSWQDTKHCTAIKACKKTMVPAPYTDSQADNCITASAFCPHSDTLSQTPPLDCEAWRVCIQ